MSESFIAKDMYWDGPDFIVISESGKQYTMRNARISNVKFDNGLPANEPFTVVSNNKLWLLGEA